MAELPLQACKPEHIAKVYRNVDNTPLTDQHKDKLRAILALLHKTWEQECVLPSAPCKPSTPTPIPAAPLVEGNEEAYYCAITTPTKGKLQQVACIESFSKPTNPLHLAAKISTHHKDYFSVRCLIRLLWANKWDVEKSYENGLKTILFRHQHLPRYWTESEIREFSRNRYMEWYGLTRQFVDPTTQRIKEQRCVILQLRAHYANPNQTPEGRCKYVLLAIEKGLHFMREMFHESQTKTIAYYHRKRPDEPFVMHDDDLKDAKKKERKDRKERESKEAAASPDKEKHHHHHHENREHHHHHHHHHHHQEGSTPSPTKSDYGLPEHAIKLIEDEVRSAFSEAQKLTAAQFNEQIEAAAKAVAAAGSGAAAAKTTGENTPTRSLSGSSTVPAGGLRPEHVVPEPEMLEGAEQLVLLMDETESTSEKMDTKFLRLIGPILNNHYVERLRYCLVINPTFISSVCVGIIKIFVDERTKSKLKLFDTPKVAMDEFLAENNLSWPGRKKLDPTLVAAGRATAADKLNDSKLSPKDLEKKLKERRKASEKRASDLKYDDLVFPCEEVIAALGVENTPMKYGGRLPPLSVNEYETWFNAIQPHPDPAQKELEKMRELARVHLTKK